MSYTRRPVRNCRICGKPTKSARFTLCSSAVCRGKWSSNRSTVFSRERRLAKAKDSVHCEVCGTRMLRVNLCHVRLHGMTMAEYHIKFPHSECTSATSFARKANATRHSTGTLLAPPELCSFMVGTLLGDGHIEPTKSADGLTGRYREGGSNEMYLRWKGDFLSKYIKTVTRERLSKPHKRTGKRYRGWWISTKLDGWFGELRRLWYVKNVKIVPRKWVDAWLTPEAFALWFFDDGHMDKGHNGAHLYTMGFTERECHWLSRLIRSKFGLKPVVRPNKDKFMLYFGAPDRPALAQLLRLHTKPGMDYKSNPPPYQSRMKNRLQNCDQV